MIKEEKREIVEEIISGITETCSTRFKAVHYQSPVSTRWPFKHCLKGPKWP